MIEGLLEFVVACLDEDQGNAERGYFKAEEIPGYDGWDKSDTVGLPPAVAVRVLREVEAKRRIVEQFTMIELPEQTDGDTAVVGAYVKMEAVLRLVALPYADRPGYKPEWAPDA